MTLRFIKRLEKNPICYCPEIEKGWQDGCAVNLLYLRTQPMENIAVLAEEFWIPKCDLYVVGLWGKYSYQERIVVNMCSDTTVGLL